MCDFDLYVANPADLQRLRECRHARGWMVVGTDLTPLALMEGSAGTRDAGMTQSAELKLRNLAAVNAQLMADLTWPNTAGTALFQWFDRQVVQGDLGLKSDGRACVTVQRIASTRVADNQGGVGHLSKVRLQLNIVAYNAEQARTIAQHMVTFMNTISLCNAGYFASPTIGPSQNPNKIRNERAGMLPQLNPPAYVETQDWELMNREDIPS